MAKEEFNPKYIKISDFVKLYSLSRQSAYALVKDGSIEAVKIGNKLLLNVDSINAYMASITVKPNELNIEEIEE